MANQAEYFSVSDATRWVVVFAGMLVNTFTTRKPPKPVYEEELALV